MLDYQNPEHWGISPLSDSALRSELERIESPEDWNPYDKFENVDDIENNVHAHTQFLAHLSGDVDPNLIWRLGEGDAAALDEITDDWRVLHRAVDIFSSLYESNYWGTYVPEED